MKFESKSIDLDLEVNLIDGKPALLAGPKNLSAEASLTLLGEWADYDKAFNEGNNGKDVEYIDIARHNDRWLCKMYKVEEGFFIKNLSLTTIYEIKTYLTDQLTNAKKN